MQKLRIRYAKRTRLRFTSHRDFQRALERALRRAEVPMAYSAGFSPHPKVSYANAASTGAASEAEYLEISVVERCDPQALRAALDEALPPGLDVIEVVEAGPGALADRLTAGEWEVVLPGLDPEPSAPAVEDVHGARVRRGGARDAEGSPDARRPRGRGADGAAGSRTTRGATWRGRRSVLGGCVRYSTWSSGSPHRPFDPTTS